VTENVTVGRPYGTTAVSVLDDSLDGCFWLPLTPGGLARNFIPKFTTRAAASPQEPLRHFTCLYPLPYSTTPLTGRAGPKTPPPLRLPEDDLAFYVEPDQLTYRVLGRTFRSFRPYRPSGLRTGWTVTRTLVVVPRVGLWTGPPNTGPGVPPRPTELAHTLSRYWRFCQNTFTGCCTCVVNGRLPRG